MRFLGSLALLASLVFTPSHAQQTGDELVIRIRSGEIGFDRARLHLPAGDKLAMTGVTQVNGQLIGFLEDYIPFENGMHEMRISKFDGACEAEEFTYHFEVAGSEVRALGGSLESTCRELVDWPAPQIIQMQGAETYYEMRFAAPVTRPADKDAADLAMAGLPKFVLVQFKSDPPGSEIYIDDELQENQTDVRLSVPFLDGLEEENRYLIRQAGLVNCYGTYPLTKRKITVTCIHKDVR